MYALRRSDYDFWLLLKVSIRTNLLGQLHSFYFSRESICVNFVYQLFGGKMYALGSENLFNVVHNVTKIYVEPLCCCILVCSFILVTRNKVTDRKSVV